MVYKLLSDLVIMLHLLWIIFILFGFLVALKYFKISYIHMAGLVFTLVLNLGRCIARSPTWKTTYTAFTTRSFTTQAHLSRTTCKSSFT